MKKLVILMTVIAGLALGGCDFIMGPDEPVGQEEGNLTISLGGGSPAGKSITSGAELPAEVLAAMRYEITLSGPDNEVLERSVSGGERLKVSVMPGGWRIDAKAYQRDSVVPAGTGSLEFTVTPGRNSVTVPMYMEGLCYEITVALPANGTVEANFAAAFEGTAVTVTAEAAEGYVLESLRYNDTAIAGGPPYTFAMPAADVTISAEFAPEETPYTITIGTFSGGTVSVEGDLAFAPAGTEITLTARPDSGYVLGSLTYGYGGADYSPDESGPDTYTFTMPSADVSVSAFFNKVIGAITIEGPLDEAVTVTPVHNAGHTPPTEISWAAMETVHFILNSPEYTVEAGNLMWLVEGERKDDDASDNSLRINARDYVLRKYNVTVMIKVNDLWYSANTSFTVGP